MSKREYKPKNAIANSRRAADVRWSRYLASQKPAKRQAVCPDCQRDHLIDQEEYNLFGHDCYCLKCVDWGHVRFMQQFAKDQKLSCVKGCRCGFGG